MKSRRSDGGEPSAVPVAQAGTDAAGKHTLVQPVQLHRSAAGGDRGEDPGAVHEAAARGTSGAGGSLPHLPTIQALFGRHDVTGVQAHTGGAAAEASNAMGAEAFATGNHVAFAGAPSLHTAAHEAAHVVQQRGGVQLKGGVGQEGDSYERHADAVADLVVQGKSAEGLLDQHAGGDGGGRAIQRAPIKTAYGEFKTTKYDAVGPAGSEYGIDINLEFDPGANVDAKKVGLTQSIVYHVTGKDVVLDPAQTGRMVTGADGKGSQIDRISPYSNPMYAANAPAAGDSLGKTPTVAGWGQHGWNYTEAGVLKHQKATLIDRPALPGRGKNSKQVFESAALAVEGRQEGSYMGSVQWGWEVDGAGTYKKLDLTLKSADVPSTGFMAAAKLWNAGTTLGTVKTAGATTNVYDAAFAVAFTVAKDTKVTIDYPMLHADEVYNKVTIADGPKAGQSGNIKTSDLKDMGDGKATIDLPIQWVGKVTAPADKKAVTLRATGSAAGDALGDLPAGAKVKVMDDSKPFLHVEIDSAQAGVALTANGTKGKDTAGMVRGYLAKDQVAR